MRAKTAIAMAALLAATLAPCAAYADCGGDELMGDEQYEQQAQAAQGALTGAEFQQAGVYYYGGRTETWYSDSELYHPRTHEWWADGEGFYRDASGNYVVAASDVPMGSALDTSRGTAVVYDTGCAWGVTDFYVHGW